MKKLPTLTFHPEILVDSARQLAKPPASESEETALVPHRFLPKFPSKMNSTCKLIHLRWHKQHLNISHIISSSCATTERYWKDLKGATVSAVILLLVLQDCSIFNSERAFCWMVKAWEIRKEIVTSKRLKGLEGFVVFPCFSMFSHFFHLILVGNLM